MKGLGLWLLFLLLAFSVHYRPEVYFYLDEWQVLSLFADAGFPAVHYTHNEHYIPLFFALEFLEARLFGSHYEYYILLSLILHSTNSYLLYLILVRLLRDGPHRKSASALLALLYAGSALHAEALQWAFVQPQLITVSLLLLSFISAQNYLRTGAKRMLSVTALLQFCAPLFFANAFAVPALLALLLFARAAASPEGRSLFRGQRARLWHLAFTSILAIPIPAALYFIFRASVGHGIDDLPPIADVRHILRYLFVGSQYGTVLRSFGFFGALGPEGAANLFSFADNPARFAAYAGVAVSLALLILGMTRREFRREALLLWIAGQAFIAVSLFLPALGRWTLGADQALSLRYHTLALIGLCIVLIPLAEHGRRCRRPILPLLIFLAITAAQLRPAKNFRYFVDYGIAHRAYVEELLQHKRSPEQFAAPVHPSSIAWRLTAEDIYRTYCWLDSEACS